VLDLTAGSHSRNESLCLPWRTIYTGGNLSIQFKLLWLPIDLHCALFWAHENLLHFLKHHRGKMTCHRGQENGDEGGKRWYQQCLCTVTDSYRQVTSAQLLPKPH
jgi:hypothetical protein